MSMTNGENQLLTSRIFDAPRERVLQAWTTPDLLARWWGPNGFTNTFHECDMQPGGTWRYTMHGPDGTDYPNCNVFVELTPEKIVLDHLTGHEFRITAAFEELEDQRTCLVFCQQFKLAEEYEQVKRFCAEANEQNLDRLGEVVYSLG